MPRLEFTSEKELPSQLAIRRSLMRLKIVELTLAQTKAQQINFELSGSTFITLADPELQKLGL